MCPRHLRSKMERNLAPRTGGSLARIALISLYNYPSMPVRLLHGVLAKKGHDPVSVFFKRHRLDRMGEPTEREYDILYSKKEHERIEEERGKGGKEKASGVSDLEAKLA